jgi:hypothetical protein
MKTVAPLCFIDTETTGVHPDRKVWEVAMIRTEPGRADRETSFFVDVDLADADPFGLAVGRFYERHPAGRWIANLGGPIEMPYGTERGAHLDRHSAALLIAKYTHGAHLVGAVPNFDAETLAPLLRASLLIPSWHYHLVDVEALAAGYIAGRNRHSQDVDTADPSPAPPWSSDELSRAVGAEPASDTERHTALGDARWAKRIYDAIIGVPA